MRWSRRLLRHPAISAYVAVLPPRRVERLSLELTDLFDGLDRSPTVRTRHGSRSSVFNIAGVASSKRRHRPEQFVTKLGDEVERDR